MEWRNWSAVLYTHFISVGGCGSGGGRKENGETDLCLTLGRGQKIIFLYGLIGHYLTGRRKGEKMRTLAIADEKLIHFALRFGDAFKRRSFDQQYINFSSSTF